MNHSPAPWNADGTVIINANDDVIAQMLAPGRPFEEVLADAILIARAPTMHAVLTRMIDAFMDNNHDEGVLALQEAADVLGRWDPVAEEVTR